MGTACTIILQLKKKDRTRDIVSICGNQYKANPQGKQYAYISTCYDGDDHTSNVLLDAYKSYDDVYALISSGCQSTIGLPFIERYKDEKWSNNSPIFADDLDDIEYVGYYSYLFEENKWWSTQEGKEILKHS